MASVALAVLAAGVLMTGAVLLQQTRERWYPAPPVSDETLYLTSGAALRRMAVGYTALAADVYWIRAIQYFGDTRLGRRSAGAAERYPLLYPLLDLTTTLDPRFNIAYRFGAVFLAEPPPSGAGRPDLAITLLEKGLHEAPEKWEYVYDIGFVHYWWRRDFVAAADWFNRAGRAPGAPWWLPSLAATTLAQGGDRASSRQMWESIRQSTDNDWLRSSAERALLQLHALDQIDALQQMVNRATPEGGLPPSDWRPFIAARRIPGVPLDPAGTPYEIDQGGRVRLGQTSSLFPLPDEPTHARPLS